MVKPADEVIAEFDELVNMSPEELEKWLDNPQSKEAGTGVGIESGHKIIAILRKNPTKEPEKYEEEDVEHMRKVVAYIGRHLAQEDHLKDSKTAEELKKTKSTISLKNWGHDPLKGMTSKDNSSQKESTQKPDVADDESGETLPSTRSKRKLESQDAEEGNNQDADAEGSDDPVLVKEDEPVEVDEKPARKRTKTEEDQAEAKENADDEAA